MEGTAVTKSTGISRLENGIVWDQKSLTKNNPEKQKEGAKKVGEPATHEEMYSF